MIQILMNWIFVTIDNGVMTVNKEAENGRSRTARFSKIRTTIVKFQELMALGNYRKFMTGFISRGDLIQRIRLEMRVVF